VKELTKSAATHVGHTATITAGAVRDVTREIGDWVSDGIEMWEAAKKAREKEGWDDNPIDGGRDGRARPMRPSPPVVSGPLGQMTPSEIIASATLTKPAMFAPWT
jgi:hypothetical protein